MEIEGYHLTYCTNIHPGETWAETFDNLKKYIPAIKDQVSPNAAFGIGLRLSDLASKELLRTGRVAEFQDWLQQNQCYVFTMNGFPFGGFHHESVKDLVHFPDWSSEKRFHYTSRLFEILAMLLPEGVEGGISTSPLSYKYWSPSSVERENVLKNATLHIAGMAKYLYEINQQQNKILHLDIEPEPDGILENSNEVVHWYKDWLIPIGTAFLRQTLNIKDEKAEIILKQHIRICYDVCHFAVVYEKPAEVFEFLEKEGIKIGKIQISAALKATLPEEEEGRERLKRALTRFVESTYLHQVVEKKSSGEMNHYPDLPEALQRGSWSPGEEWRIHFHVPIFLDSYGYLESTQNEISEVLHYLEKNQNTAHLEVETYTWEVLPDDIRLQMTDSIVRELQWVQKRLK